MQYTQLNPLPLPEAGALGSVSTQIETTFDWEYALRHRDLMALYEKGKAATWNASDLDWSTPVDIEKIFTERRQAAGGADLFNRLLDPPHRLDEKQNLELNININAWMLSQFLHGEQGALVATAKIVQTVPFEEAKFYAANQVADEARHVEVYHRYLTEKLGVSFEVNRNLGELLDTTCADSRWDMTYLGMQIMVEGLALAAFGMLKLTMPEEPLLQDLTRRVMGDEARHVAFGVLTLGELYRNGEFTPQEMREREDFVIEATELMRDRLLMEQVFERMDLDVPIWLAWARETPFMKAFRQVLFAKIVPNLKRIGLLTPRVREAYAKLDLLRYENELDSTQEIEAQPPAEFLRLVATMLGQAPAASA